MLLAGAPGGHAWLINKTGALYRTTPPAVAVRLQQAEFDDPSDRGEHLRASPAVLADLGLSSTHDFTRAGARPQVLVTTADRLALFTVGGVLPASPGASTSQVALTAKGFARLRVAVPQTGATLPGQLSTRLSDVPRALFAEEPVVGPAGAAVAVLAPHGGHIEPNSDTLAEQLARQLAGRGVRTWTARGRNLTGEQGDTPPAGTSSARTCPSAPSPV